MKNVLVIGATSAIAQACARRFAPQGARFFLVARNSDRLNFVANDLISRGAAGVKSVEIDLACIDLHDEMLQAATRYLERMDIVLVAHGTLPQQSLCERSAAETVREWANNATSTIALLTLVANQLEQQRGGTLCVITSVAGDRGRPSNYVYGAAKAAVTTFAQGLRGRLFTSGVHVLVVKPGFVDTPMTASFKKGLLWSSPERVARCIVRAIEKKYDVAYCPGFWRWIMLVITLLPERLFKRIKL